MVLRDADYSVTDLLNLFRQGVVINLLTTFNRYSRIFFVDLLFEFKVVMTDKNLTYKKIFMFWLPLASTWLMMSVEGPFLSAIISRMPDPKFNLAAYGVAFSFALILEAPIIMIMSASTALVKNRITFYKLRNFSFAANFTITAGMLVLLIPPVFNFLVLDLIGLPLHVSELTYKATALLLPWPAAIGYRRFYQGILINHNKTRLVAYGTVIRLIFMGSTALILYNFFHLDGVMVGAASLSAGVISESASSKFMVDSIRRKLIVKESSETITYREIWNFYLPLALTSIMTLGVHPAVTFFLGQSRNSLESLAILPVVNSFVFIFRALGLSYQEVGIALLGEKFEAYHKLRNFATFLGISVVVVLGIIAFSPLSRLWFADVSGLTPELIEFSIPTLRIIMILPGLTMLISWQRSVLVQTRNTKPITWATAIEVTGIVIVVSLSVLVFDITGAYGAGIAYIFGRLGANVYLLSPYNKSVSAALG